MGLTAMRQRERRVAQGAPVSAPPITMDQRLTERGAECSRLRAENLSLRKRVEELEQKLATAAQPQTDQPRQNQKTRR